MKLLNFSYVSITHGTITWTTDISERKIAACNGTLHEGKICAETVAVGQSAMC